MTKNKKIEVPHHMGHRKRLKTRFKNNGGDSLAEYEILELILFRSLPRKDTKPIAKRLIDKFNSLDGVLTASLEGLTKIQGVGEEVAVDIKIMQHLTQRKKLAELMKKPVLGRLPKVIEYCKDVMGNEPLEQFRVLFLNKQNELILDEVLNVGSVDTVPVYPSQVIKKATDIYATAIILVHNHPSGDAMPSEHDKEMTMTIQQAAAVFGIVVHDHIIVSGREHKSMRKMGML